jgi:hypothetical protein
MHEPTVKIETDDKHMNFEHGGLQYRSNDHVAEVPASFAQQLKEADVPGVRKHRKLVGFSDLSDEAWARIMRR